MAAKQRSGVVEYAVPGIDRSRTHWPAERLITGGGGFSSRVESVHDLSQGFRHRAVSSGCVLSLNLIPFVSSTVRRRASSTTSSELRPSITCHHPGLAAFLFVAGIAAVASAAG